jgi:hypothetical protein
MALEKRMTARLAELQRTSPSARFAAPRRNLLLPAASQYPDFLNTYAVEASASHSAFKLPPALRYRSD